LFGLLFNLGNLFLQNVDFDKRVVHSTPREYYLGYFLLSVGGFPVALQYAVRHSDRFTSGPVVFILGAAVGHVFPFWALSGFYNLHDGPYVLVVLVF
jgi:hypothetical protein